MKEQLTLLHQLLECAILVSDNEIKALQYDPVGFADMVANLPNPCNLGDVIDVISQFVGAEIKYIEEEKQ